MIDRRRTLRARDYVLAFEAAVGLLWARVLLGAVPFRRIASWSTREVRGRRLSDAEHRSRAIADVRWAIAAAGASLHGATACFPRALAAQAMLRRRGVATTMTYGARPSAGWLEAHVWLTAGADAVVGHEVAPEYSPIAVYSNDGRAETMPEGSWNPDLTDS
jgi:hypothetical protein